MADQVYVTHCLQSDSVSNQAGFGVRATSTQDPELLKFAADYPAYELPLDMWSSEPTPAQAPRRLAMVPAPRNSVALIQSVYAGQDTLGRGGNYFGHVIFYSALAVSDALESWAAAEWQTSYPRGAAKLLPKLPERPFKGTLIQSDNLTRFLAGKNVDNPADLATLICPRRLQGDADRCQQLLTQTLEGFLAAWTAGAGAPRNRLYLVAEPGLTALLLYGVVRLLPPDTTAGLSFSTFENAHRALRQYKLAFACGTYTSDPQKGLEPEYFRARGYGLDTLVPERISPELAREPAQSTTELVRLAREGRWEMLQLIHECHAPGMVSGDSLRAAAKMCNLFQKAKNGNLTPEELLQVRRLPDALGFMQKHHAIFWPIVLRSSLANETVRREFAALIRDHAAELTAQAGRLAGAANPQWRDVWGLVKAGEDSPAKVATAFMTLLQHANQGDPTRAYLATLRLPLLQESQAAAPAVKGIPAGIRELLFVNNAATFAQLQAAPLPAEWLAYSLSAVLANPGPQPWAVEAAQTASDALLPSVAATLMDAKSTPDLLRVLLLLVPTSANYPLFLKLLKHGLVVPPEILTQFFNAIGDFKPLPARAWLKGDSLQRLLVGIDPYKERAHPVWQRFCTGIDSGLFFADAQQSALYQNLIAARAKCPGSLPAGCDQMLNDWSLLDRLFNSPQEISARKEDLELVCKRRGWPDTVKLLREYFGRVVQLHGVNDPQASTFVETFQKLAPPGDGYQQHLGRFDFWLKVLQGAEDTQTVAAYQLYYLERFVPLQFRRSMVKERRDRIDPGTHAAVVQAAALQDARASAEAVAVAVSEPSTTSQKRLYNGADERGEKSGSTSFIKAFGGLTFVKMAILLAFLALTHLVFAAAGWGVGRFLGATPPQGPSEELLGGVYSDLQATRKKLTESPLNAHIQGLDLTDPVDGDMFAKVRSIAAKLKSLKDKPVAPLPTPAPPTPLASADQITVKRKAFDALGKAIKATAEEIKPAKGKVVDVTELKTLMESLNEAIVESKGEWTSIGEFQKNLQRISSLGAEHRPAPIVEVRDNTSPDAREQLASFLSVSRKLLNSGVFDPFIDKALLNTAIADLEKQELAVGNKKVDVMALRPLANSLGALEKLAPTARTRDANLKTLAFLELFKDVELMNVTECNGKVAKSMRATLGLFEKDDESDTNRKQLDEFLSKEVSFAKRLNLVDSPNENQIATWKAEAAKIRMWQEQLRKNAAFSGPNDDKDKPNFESLKKHNEMLSDLIGGYKKALLPATKLNGK